MPGPDEQPRPHLHRIVRSFAASSMPALSRKNYLWELRAAALVPTAVACVEGAVVGVIANKAFIGPGAPDSWRYAVAVLAAAGPLALLTSVFWTRVFHGRDRVRCVNLLQVAVALCVAVIATAPLNAAGLLMLTGATLAARVCLAGVITARSDIWRANYPRTDRARATGKITTVTTLVAGVTGLVVAWAMDLDATGAHGFRFVYAGAVVAALAGAWAFSHVRWRAGRWHAARERRDTDAGEPAPGAMAMLRVLRGDRFYRRFMIAQFILGAPNLAAVPVFIVALEDVFDRDYTQSILLTHAIPIMIPMLAIPLWSRLLDRVHVVRFRSIHSWFFVAANLLTALGFMAGAEWALYVARVTLGVAFGGGMLAWSLGHHDFASRELASVYMGVHVTLTGVRGALAPFLGLLLYQGVDLTPLGVPVSIPGLGGATFLLLAGVGVYGALLFLRMRLEMKRRAIDAPPEER